jgi:hypothetical protein
LPGDPTVSFAARVVARSALPLGVLVGALLVSEALDGLLSRRIVVRDRRRPTGLSALASRRHSRGRLAGDAGGARPAV